MLSRCCVKLISINRNLNQTTSTLSSNTCQAACALSEHRIHSPAIALHCFGRHKCLHRSGEAAAMNSVRAAHPAQQLARQRKRKSNTLLTRASGDGHILKQLGTRAPRLGYRTEKSIRIRLCECAADPRDPLVLAYKVQRAQHGTVADLRAKRRQPEIICSAVSPRSTR